jgi:hypothetical protein
MYAIKCYRILQTPPRSTDKDYGRVNFDGQKEKEDHRGKPLKENPNIERRLTTWANT